MQIPGLRNALLLKNNLISSTSTTTHFASFHITPTSCEKWKNKWNSNYVSYAIRSVLMQRNPYKIFSKNFRLLALKWHPDKHQAFTGNS